ncbi:uncharacterized protein BDZ99DRAFT_481363 [Mytilinidion resinicola]|uniref:Uncharacterized protein n=1 Tax=Mytilinidion resinicola TaxID=574789 RepID=A0A6A6Y5S3_9PEZI|nr:uncharacterized protein BDZ99DRAFT_481363 [Mytilinidion resinicola]KAF2804191.1 hypothetical protein BDZ99DRAFT_481363 [Mytilinidion resinicola]
MIKDPIIDFATEPSFSANSLGRPFEELDIKPFLDELNNFSTHHTRDLFKSKNTNAPEAQAEDARICVVKIALMEIELFQVKLGNSLLLQTSSTDGELLGKYSSYITQSPAFSLPELATATTGAAIPSTRANMFQNYSGNRRPYHAVRQIGSRVVARASKTASRNHTT